MTATAEGTGSALDRTRLLKDLQAQARVLEDDLRARTDSAPGFRDALRGEYEKAVAAERTAAMYETWRDERVVQIAAAWVPACVFVRFSEDNGLIPDAWLSGPGDRLAEAQDRHDDFFRRNPSLNDRDWLLASFDALARSHRTVEGLFDPAHNPLFEVLPSYEADTALLAFWRQRGADGEVVHDFTNGELNTLFLGDLYQDLSEHASGRRAINGTLGLGGVLRVHWHRTPGIPACPAAAPHAQSGVGRARTRVGQARALQSHTRRCACP